MRINENAPAFRAVELAALLARHYPEATPFAVAKTVAELQRAARASKAWQLRRCNEPMSEAQEEAGYRRMGNAEDRLNGKLMEARLNGRDDATRHDPARVELGGDPRGPCARLHIPGLAGDGRGEGFAVY